MPLIYIYICIEIVYTGHHDFVCLIKWGEGWAAGGGKEEGQSDWNLVQEGKGYKMR